MNADAVFFTDTTFKRDVRDFFGFTVYDHNDHNNHNNSSYNNPKRIKRVPTLKSIPDYSAAPVYKAADDDLAVWKKRIEAEDRMKSNNIQSNTDRFKSQADEYREKLLKNLRKKLA